MDRFAMGKAAKIIALIFLIMACSTVRQRVRYDKEQDIWVIKTTMGNFFSSEVFAKTQEEMTNIMIHEEQFARFLKKIYKESDK
jgi:hypothetical protein